MMLYFSALPVVRARGQWNYSLPNPLNISFNFHYFLLFTILLYIPRKFSLSILLQNAFIGSINESLSYDT